MNDTWFDPEVQNVPKHLHKYWDGLQVCMPPVEIEKLPIRRITNDEWLEHTTRVELVTIDRYMETAYRPDGVTPTKYELGHDGSYRYEVLKITDVKARCDCGWEGTTGDCEPDDDGDGDLLCPECLELATIIYITEEGI